MDLRIDPASTVPPYEQLRTQVARQATDGSLPAGTRLPPVRQLAAHLGLAANTVARAYKELEADGVVVTEGRRGTFVRSAALDRPPPDVGSAVSALAHAARRRGLTLAETQRLVEAAWSGRD
ncbi:MAG TPA: GntR family transcriptional regulator [Nocardioides sp.]|uniref:GntR family transcriptional regulator n=1 Tax=Nocardioides sp. TaxID=35761 RepID=UPI002D8096A0|nr:GntR family transcriptional regulator [Nocardioides sp.]HET6652076.1 GntR family transcriptional regulator [Nocardioides sp.]